MRKGFDKHIRLSKEELNELGIMLNNEDFDNEDKE